jgi:hypothetical protein
VRVPSAPTPRRASCTSTPTRSARRSRPGRRASARTPTPRTSRAAQLPGRGDLVEHEGRLVLHPHRVVAGLQLRRRRSTAIGSTSARSCASARPRATASARAVAARRRADAPARRAARGLTVAVTGPTGEIGKAVHRGAREGTRARDRAHRRHGPAAVRPRRARLEAHRVPPRRRARPGGGRGACRRRRRRRAPRVHRRAGVVGHAQHQRRGLAQRVRGRRRGGCKAARLRLVGRGVRLPEDADGLLTERCPRAATTASPTPRTRPRSRRS